MTTDQEMEAILQELADEGQVIQRDGRWGLTSWPEERWQLPEPTEEEVVAKLDAARSEGRIGRTGDTDVAADLLGVDPRQGPVPGTLAMKLGQCWVDGCDNDAYTRASFRDQKTGTQVTGLVCPDHGGQVGVGGYVDLKPGVRESIDRRVRSAPRATGIPAEFAQTIHDKVKPKVEVPSLAEYAQARGGQPVSLTGAEFARMVHEGVVTVGCRDCGWEAPGDTPMIQGEAFIDHQMAEHGKTRSEAGNTEAHVTVSGADLEVDVDGRRGRGSLTDHDLAVAKANAAKAVLAESYARRKELSPGDDAPLEKLEAAAEGNREMAEKLRAQVRSLRGDYVDSHRAERDSEAVAEVIKDIRNFDVQPAVGNKEGFFGMLNLWSGEAKIIDATPIYHQAVGRGEWNAYEDHPSIAPPFGEFVIGYRNQFGNVIVMHTVTVDQKEADGMDPALVEYLTDEWPTANVVDWDRVRWRLFISLWLGGKGGDGTAVPTSGPWYGWRIAVYDTGEPADITWIDLGPKPGSDWDMAHCTYLDALYYLNCRNIEYVEPRRSRGFARRMHRMGVKVGQIRVFPVARSSRTARGEGTAVGADSPATAVRGHFAHYGDCCPGRHPPRGLLFGKLQGRFFIPPHARGNPELGSNENTYILEAGR